jgi:uncharacterized membrane protein
MDLHPIFVHFPIALLVVYAFLEIISVRKLQSLPYWFYVKAIMVIFGAMGAVVARQTGEFAGEALEKAGLADKLLETHELFANATTIIFVIMAVAYIVVWVNKDKADFVSGSGLWVKIWMFASKISRVLVETQLAKLVALVGLVCVTITGGLGGMMVFGEKKDPIFVWIYNTFLK